MEADFIERKKKIWEVVKPQIEEEVAGKYEVGVQGLSEYSEYFHPIVRLGNFGYLKTQCDVDDESYYSLSLILFIGNGNIEIRIVDDLKLAIKVLETSKIEDCVKVLRTEINKMI